MELFKSGLKSVLGAPEQGNTPSAAETVERLVDRVNNSTLLEDRRDACRALKAMSRKYRIEVGTQSMDTLKQVLELDRGDCETVNYALDTLNNVVSPDPFEEEEDNPRIPVNIGEQFTEMYLKDPHNVQIILDLLDEYDFRVRLSCVRLLTSLLTNRPRDIQEVILVKPMGVSKLMDLLGDSREVIRNETLLLLIRLTKGNANIQKIVAFENAFDRIFEVISTEGFAEGGIIVEDCLLLMLNLLKNNGSNINFFKEGSYIQRMLPMFKTPDESEDVVWSPQKVSNIHCMIQIVRTLVSPSNPAQIIQSCQKIMRNVGLLEALCNILMASGVPADILTETINAVGEVVRGDISNQEYLGNVMAPSNPPRPAIVVLLMSMVNEKQPFSLRCAVLYCFQCYLYHNEAGQAALVQTLLPSSTDVSTVTTGQLLCGGLFSGEPLSNWFAAAALSHALVDSAAQKERLLRVLLATNIGSGPVSLLHQCAALLVCAAKLQPKVGLLMLLAQWTCGCPAAVAALLQAPGAVAYLATQAAATEHEEEPLLQGLCAFLLAVCVHYNDDSVPAYTKENLRQLVTKRVGVEALCSRVAELSRAEACSRAAKHPQPRAASSPSELLLDYEFCKLLKMQESVVLASVNPPQQNGDRESPSGVDSAALEQYKSLIRQQDARLQELCRQLDSMLQQNTSLQSTLNDAVASNMHLKDENTLLKAQIAAVHPNCAQGVPPQAVPPPAKTRAVAPDPRLMEAEAKIDKLNREVVELRQLLGASEAQGKKAMEELEKLKVDQDDLLLLLSDQDAKLTEYRMRLLSLGQVLDDEIASTSQEHT